MLTLLCAAWHAVISGGGGLQPKESTTTRIMIDRLQLMQICSKLSTHTISQQQFHQLWGILANSAVMAKTGHHEHGDDTDAEPPGGYSGGSGGGVREAFHAGDWLVVRETAVTEAGARGGGRVPGGAVPGGVGLVGRRRWCTLVNGQLRFADQRNGATKEAIDMADVRRVVQLAGEPPRSRGISFTVGGGSRAGVLGSVLGGVAGAVGGAAARSVAGAVRSVAGAAATLHSVDDDADAAEALGGAQVTVRVAAARGLAGMDRSGTSDPYVVVRCIEGNGRRTTAQKSKVISRSLAPVWAEGEATFCFGGLGPAATSTGGATEGREGQGTAAAGEGQGCAGEGEATAAELPALAVGQERTGISMTAAVEDDPEGDDAAAATAAAAAAASIALTQQQQQQQARDSSVDAEKAGGQEESSLMIEIEAWDADTFSRDTPLGRVRISAAPAAMDGQLRWHTLGLMGHGLTQQTGACGEVQVCCSYAAPVEQLLPPKGREEQQDEVEATAAAAEEEEEEGVGAKGQPTHTLELHGHTPEGSEPVGGGSSAADPEVESVPRIALLLEGRWVELKLETVSDHGVSGVDGGVGAAAVRSWWEQLEAGRRWAQNLHVERISLAELLLGFATLPRTPQLAALFGFMQQGRGASGGGTATALVDRPVDEVHAKALMAQLGLMEQFGVRILQHHQEKLDEETLTARLQRSAEQQLHVLTDAEKARMVEIKQRTAMRCCLYGGITCLVASVFEYWASIEFNTTGIGCFDPDRGCAEIAFWVVVLLSLGITTFIEILLLYLDSLRSS
jgi:hypothetical protein